MSRKVAIIGTGMAKSGKSEVPSWLLFADAALEAINEAGLELTDIQGLHLGNTYSAYTESQTNISPLVLSVMGIDNNIPCIRYEAACCSGSIAFRQGYLNILSGMYDVMLVGGAERLRAVSGMKVQEAMATCMDASERNTGLTFGAFWTYVAKAYARKHGLSLERLQELLAEITVKNHFHGSFNKKAHFQNLVTVEDVMQSPVVSPPIKLLDCCPFSDGAAALVIASEEVAKRVKNPIWIQGSGQASGSVQIAEVSDLGSPNPGLIKAVQDAYKHAGMAPGDIDIAEVHDCVNIHEVLCLEGAGFYGPEETLHLAAEHKTYFDGEMPVNLSGGLKTRGHPVGATGAYQLCEITRLLRGDFEGKRPAKPVNVGLTMNAGGTGSVYTAHILIKE
ncbi:MAG: propanoyl-CoA acyltransferase [Pseudomonadota bacterium]